MREQIDLAIEVLADKINEDTTAEDALRFTHSLLNLANAKAQLEGIRDPD